MTVRSKGLKVVRAARELQFRAYDEMGHERGRVADVSVRQGTFGLVIGEGIRKGAHQVLFEYGRLSTVTAEVDSKDIVPGHVSFI